MKEQQCIDSYTLPLFSFKRKRSNYVVVQSLITGWYCILKNSKVVDIFKTKGEVYESIYNL